MDYEVTIGLEIHAELKTKTKMFCSCLNDPEEKVPNKNICPVCLAHPGVLPVINKEAVKKVLLVGLSLGSEIPEFSKFDRKNYFYPDLPKGYQISQYDEPLCKGGKLPLFLGEEDLMQTTIEIERVHLEEDTGKLIHSEDKKFTFIDYNRAGVPLMELVTKPVIHSAKEARLFASSLQLLLKTLKVSEANMEQGQMRCEVNISLKPKGQKELGTKVEIKNLNSFRAVEKAIEYEILRQTQLLEQGEKIIQETRGWDDSKGITVSQRVKEEAQDYRYFPEPDLPALHLYSQKQTGGLFDLEELKKELPLLPWQKKEQLMTTYHLPSLGANLMLEDEALLSFFEQTVNFLKTTASQYDKALSDAYHYLISDILGIKEKEGLTWGELKLTPQNFAELILYLNNNKITSRVAKDVLLEIIQTGARAQEIIKSKNLEQITDNSLLEKIIEEVIQNNPKAVEDFKKGKETVIQFLVGQSMAKLKGAANPLELEQLIRQKLTH